MRHISKGQIGRAEQISFVIDPLDKEAMFHLAERTERTPSEHYRRAVREYLIREKGNLNGVAG